MCSAERNEPATSVLGRMDRLLRAFDVDHSVLGIAELSRRSGLAKTTTHRLVGELLALDLLEPTGDGVRLGMRLFELGQLVPRQRTLREAALPFMEHLHDATRAPVHLAVLDELEVVYVEILGASALPQLPSRVGGRLPAHMTGVGKAMLAFNGLAAADLIIIPASAERMAVDGVADLINHVQKIMWKKFSLNHQELRILFTMYRATTSHSRRLTSR